ncbi:MAG TPA: FecR family protein [Candidatus Polarisedimenticolia bacterium]|nr:FecR family protein [Candidatus Polarisedimenticolia bacterium]
MVVYSLTQGALMLGLWIGAAAPAPPAAQQAPARAAAAHWKMVAASGKVETRLPAAALDTWRAVRRGDRVAPLTHLRTQQRAHATLTRRGDLILVDAGSEIVVPETAPGEGTSVLQRTGNALYKVAPRRQGERFEVRTPYLVAGVKGTRFSVHVGEGSAAVSVLEGVVEVTSTLTGESIDLTAGQSVLVEERGTRLELHERAPQAPPAAADAPRDAAAEILATSARLDRTLEKDSSLADPGSDLWADLDDDSITRKTTSMDRTLDKSTSLLDPIKETKREATLLDAAPLPRQP